MGVFAQNLKFAVRQLFRNPGFSATVIFTLALAIGANTAIFSIVNALMLKNLPYAHPERMGAIFTRVTGPAPSDGNSILDGKQWALLRDNAPSLLSAVSGWGIAGVNLQAGQRVQYLHAGRISEHYLDVLSIHPVAGRNFTADEDRLHGPKAAILSYGLWRTVFGSDRNLIGQSILLKGEPYTVVGILPQGATTPLNADLYTALQPSSEGEGQGHNYKVITRLREGATWQQADAEINRAWARPAAGFQKENSGTRVAFYSVPLQKGQAAELRPEALTLMLAAGFILLIACANLAGLTLVRVARRTPEMATRLALGASRWQVQKQLWVENLLLACLGGVAGIAVGYAALRGLLSLLPEDFLPVASVPLDTRVLLFTLAVSLSTSVLFGMLPALTLRKIELRSAISSGSRTVAGGSRLGLRQALIAGEVALTVVLLAASGLLIRTLIHLETLPPGFEPTGVMTAKASLDDARYRDPAAFRKLLDSTTAAMQQIPGVKNAAVGLTLPYERPLNSDFAIHDGHEAGQHGESDVVYVTPGYFDTLRIPLLAGRGFAASDGPHTQPVVIVNQSFAKKFFHGANPVGRTLNKNEMIVGVVADVQLSPCFGNPGPLSSEETMYVPAAQVEPNLLSLVHIWFQPSWIVRTGAPVEGLTAQMQRALASADPSLPFSGFYSMNDLRAETLNKQRIEVALLSAMAGLALLLSSVGIFALVANLVAERTREIGIRIALGASPRQAMGQIAGSGLRASALGLTLGLLLSIGALRVLRSVLYGVGVYDAPTLVGVTLTLAVVTLLAATAPALRIARIDPAQTLRDE
jgi:predicted permease